MKNNKGFVMTETLVVTVFLVTIFTFIYISIVPLLGKYEDMVYRKSDIDIVYKLYHIRKMISTDDNRSVIMGTSFRNITCDDVANKDYCSRLMRFLELNNYLLVCTNSIANNLDNFSSRSEEMYDYIKDYQDLEGKVLVLIDNSNHTVAHLTYYG